MLFKRLLALGVILTLLGIIVYNVIADNQTSEEEMNGPLFVVPENMDVDMTGVDVGDLAKDFQLRDLDGNLVRLSDLRGKKVFLNFWASWCGPCKAEMPHMQDFYEKYSDEVEIIAVNVTGSEVNSSNVKKFVDDYELTFPVLLDDTNEVSVTYLALQLPTTYFINSDGIIQLQRKIGPMTYEEMEKKMKQLD
ncbi:redoxin domain-containing protein [Bacillaceae bacterium W0354]